MENPVIPLTSACSSGKPEDRTAFGDAGQFDVVAAVPDP
jgi:hypothetical protein